MALRTGCRALGRRSNCCQRGGRCRTFGGVWWFIIISTMLNARLILLRDLSIANPQPINQKKFICLSLLLTFLGCLLLQMSSDFFPDLLNNPRNFFMHVLHRIGLPHQKSEYGLSHQLPTLEKDRTIFGIVVAPDSKFQTVSSPNLHNN